MKVLRVLGGGAAHGLVERIRPAFEAETGWTIDGSFSPVGAMRDRLLAGEPADVVILSRALIEQLVKSGHLVASSAADVCRVATALAVRVGDPLPEVGTAETLRAALAAADEIHFPDPAQATAGIHFAGVIRQLGLADQLASHLRIGPNGATAMRALAASQTPRPIGCTQETEIRATPGVVLVAPLPAGCELVTTYTAAVTARAQVSAEAAAVVAALIAGSIR